MAEIPQETWRLIIYEIEIETKAKTVNDILEQTFYATSGRTGIPYKKSMRERAFKWAVDYLDDNMVRDDSWDLVRTDTPPIVQASRWFGVERLDDPTARVVEGTPEFFDARGGGGDELEWLPDIEKFRVYSSGAHSEDYHNPYPKDLLTGAVILTQLLNYAELTGTECPYRVRRR